MNKKYIAIISICFILSIISGIIAKDLIIGGTILFSGLLCAYFASEGKRVNYIFGLINYIFIFAPLQIHGFSTWKKNLNKDNNVNVREFNLKNSIIITSSCITGSFILAFLLNLIPNQRLALMDAASNCINLCGVVLMILRFKEAWWLWFINNIIDLSIWIITTLNNGTGSVMMLLVSIGYLLINIYGMIKWHINVRKSKV